MLASPAIDTPISYALSGLVVDSSLPEHAGPSALPNGDLVEDHLVLAQDLVLVLVGEFAGDLAGDPARTEQALGRQAAHGTAVDSQPGAVDAHSEKVSARRGGRGWRICFWTGAAGGPTARIFYPDP